MKGTMYAKSVFVCTQKVTRASGTCYLHDEQQGHQAISAQDAYNRSNTCAQYCTCMAVLVHISMCVVPHLAMGNAARMFSVEKAGARPLRTCACFGPPGSVKIPLQFVGFSWHSNQRILLELAASKHICLRVCRFPDHRSIGWSQQLSLLCKQHT